MSRDTLAILLSVAAWRRYCDYWAGVEPWAREQYSEQDWL